MPRYIMTSIIIVIVVVLFIISINAQHISKCDTLDENKSLRRICDDEQSLQKIFDTEEEDLIPDFDLTQIETENDANQILKRFRRGRFSSSGSSSRSSSSSSSSRSSSSSSSGGSSFFGGSRSSSSSSGGSSGIFSRSSGSSSSSRSSSGGLFSRGSSSSSSGSGSGGLFSRGSSSSSSGSSSGGLFSRSTSSGTDHRTREAIRTAIRKTMSSGTASNTGGSKPSLSDKIRKITHGGGSSGTSGFGTGGTGGLSGISGSKPGLSDKIRKITHGGGSSGTSGFGTGGTGGLSGIGGTKPSLSDKIRKVVHSGGTSGFGMGGSGGSGGNAWVRTGKKFLPVAVRFGKRYYQRRKYKKAMYAGAGAGAGYYAGSRMNQHGHHYPNEQYDPNEQYYSNDNYGYPPVIDNPPDEIEGKKPTVFFCIQEDLNTTLVNQTLDKEGFGVCNISGELVTCPIEIECKLSEADNCCEDDQGTPYCCGGSIPTEYISQYGGYADDYEGGSVTLNIFTAIWIMMSTICFIIWQQRE